MSNAYQTFAETIKDAENLLQHFNALNTLPPPPELEVLKRAGLVMAMTAWETYVEDRVLEAVKLRLSDQADRFIAEFVEAKLANELKRLNNPDSRKTVKLFRDFAGVDLNEGWCWNNFDPKTVKTTLNHYMKLRGDVVHRSRPISGNASTAHPVKKEDLERAISFLKNLVDATENAITTDQVTHISGEAV
jgi:hypothetical protein